MKTRKYLFCLLLLASLLNVSCHDDDDAEETCASSSLSDYPVVRCGQIIASTGFGMGVDDSQQNRSWALVTAESLRMQYLGEFSWGAVFITVGGDPVNPPRPSYDFSQYTRMAIEMKGASGNECVQIGMKDANDPDDGSETKIPVRLTTEWQRYEFSLSDFTTCQLNQTYVVAEFVFPCSGENQAQTIEVRNIGFLR